MILLNFKRNERISPDFEEGSEQRIAKVRSWNMKVKHALIQSLKQQIRLTDHEQNNFCIFGLIEGVKGSFVM